MVVVALFLLSIPQCVALLPSQQYLLLLLLLPSLMMMKRQSLRDNQQHPAVAPRPLPVSFVAVVADFFPSFVLSLMLNAACSARM